MYIINNNIYYKIIHSFHLFILLFIVSIFLIRILYLKKYTYYKYTYRNKHIF